MITNKCGDCYFFVPTVTTKGDCHLNPPQVMSTGNKVYNAYPPIETATIGCSHFVPSVEAQRKGKK